MREALSPTALPTPAGYSQVVRVEGGTTIHIARPGTPTTGWWGPVTDAPA